MMIKIKVLHILFLIIGLTHFGFSQKLLKQFNVDNGLLSSESYQVVQDHKGYIWITTDEGVSRYDGYGFKHYNTNDGLLENTVLELYEDYKKRLWFVSITNELCYLENDVIYPYAYNDSIEKYNEINSFPIKKSFYVDSADNLYYGTYQNDILKISTSGEVSFIKSKDQFTSRIFKVENKILFSSKIKNGSQIVKIEDPFCLDSTIILRISKFVNRSFVCNYDDKLLFSRYDKLLVVRPDGNHTVVKFNKDILWISIDSENRICVSFYKGGVKFFNNLDFSKADYHLLPNYSVTSVLNDNEDGYWISTLENGIYLFSSLKIKFFDQKNGISFIPLHHIITNENRVFFAGESGFYNTIDENNLITSYLTDNRLPDNAATTLLDFNANRLFISYKRYGIYEINMNKASSIYGVSYFNTYNPNKGLDIFYRSNNTLLFPFNERQKQLNIRHKKYNQVYESIQINDSVSWVVTDQGLFEFTIYLSRYLNKSSYYFTKRNSCMLKEEVEEIKGNKKIIKKIYTIKRVGEHPLLKTRLKSITKDSYGNFWLGTSNSGILWYDGDSVKHFAGLNRFENFSINKIKSLDSLLILCTASGLYKIPQIYDSINVSKLVNYTSGIGLASNEINDFDILNNNIYLATNKGLSIVPLHYDVYQSPLHLYKIKINEKDTIISQSYDLPYDKNYIEIFFKSLNYQRQSDITYQYKLEGIENSWNMTTGQSVKYSYLAPGEYRFLLKSVNSLGVETIYSNPITFVINKPYYKTVWFVLLMVIAGLFIVFVVFLIVLRFRLKEARKRYSVEQELNRSRQQALSAQMNPHFIYNSLNSVQSYILKNEKVKASEYLSKLGRLMRNILNNSQNQTISLREEFDALEKYMEMEQLRFKELFTYKFNICSQIDIDKIQVPPLIIQPFVENAIHHGLRLRKENGELLVDACIKEGVLRIVVQDNGVGIENAKQYNSKNRKNHKSFGTEITHKRLQLLEEMNREKVTLSVSETYPDNKLNPGTKIVLLIKLS
jgi:sensor histidine kinase YesM